jgi:DeoR/GlpR family transcriptional regulator of sugar metabolism
VLVRKEFSLRKPNGDQDAGAQSARRTRIRQDALDHGYVSIDALAASLDVSAMTIHRDLDALASEGWLLKVRGGARIHPAALLDTTVRSRAERNIPEKRAIAAQALTHVRQGHVVFLDESTSASAMIDALPQRGPLTVVTNSLSVITRLSGEPGIDVISTGGTYRHGYDAFFGMIATDAASRLQADILFMSTTAIDHGYCCHKSEETVQFKHALIKSSAFKVLLVDHSKFGLRALHKLAPVTDFDLIITDDGIAAADRTELESRGVTVEIAPLDETAGSAVGQRMG